MEEITPRTLKNISTAQTIAEGLANKKTWTEIASDIGISRQQLYAELRENPELKGLIIAEITEMETQLKNWIDQNLYSQNPANQRAAMQELGKMTRHAKDKSYPTLFRTENININLDLTQLQQDRKRLLETLNRLPPTTRTQFWNHWTQIGKEWNLQEPTP